MSRYAINKAADELGISHQTALLVWEFVDSKEEFLAALDDLAAGRGFVFID